MRLAAAKSVLRLSKKWDLLITPEIFTLTVLMIKVYWLCLGYYGVEKA